MLEYQDGEYATFAKRLPCNERSGMEFEINRCVCGSKSSIAAFRMSDYNFNSTDEVATMLRCLDCGSLFPDRFPDRFSISQAYQSYYTDTSIRTRFSRKASILEHLRGDSASRNIPIHARKVMDFGCGSGAWLARMKCLRPSLQLVGTDVTKPRNNHSEFRWMEIDEMFSVGEKFDWITLSHVIEHLHNPREIISKLSERVMPGGGIWISTPDAESFLFEIQEGRARDADFPRHRQVFSEKLLAHLLEESGLRVVKYSAPRINTVLNLISVLKSHRDKIDSRGKYAEIFIAFAIWVAGAFKNPVFGFQTNCEIIIAGLKD